MFGPEQAFPRARGASGTPRRFGLRRFTAPGEFNPTKDGGAVQRCVRTPRPDDPRVQVDACTRVAGSPVTRQSRERSPRRFDPVPPDARPSPTTPATSPRRPSSTKSSARSSYPSSPGLAQQAPPSLGSSSEKFAASSSAACWRTASCASTATPVATTGSSPSRARAAASALPGVGHSAFEPMRAEAHRDPGSDFDQSPTDDRFSNEDS